MTKRSGWLVAVVGLAVLLSSGLEARADEVFLTTGRSIKGEVISERGKFVVVLTNIDEREARKQARHLVDRVRQLRVPALGPTRTLSCSVGAVWGRPRPGTSPADLFTSADELRNHNSLSPQPYQIFLEKFFRKRSENFGPL